MVEYTAVDSAKVFHESNKKYKALWGPVGSGKSSAALWEFIFLCMESTVPLVGVVVRSSYRELQDTTRKTFFEWFGAFSHYIERDEVAIVTLPGPDGVMREHELRFRAIQRPEETVKLQSAEYAFMFLEECVPSFATTGVMGAGLPKAILDIARLRLRQKGAPRHVCVCTANPPAPSHWYYQEFIKPHGEEMEKKNAICIFQPAGENSKNLVAGYYDELRNTLPSDMVRRFVDGEVIPAYDGVAVFPECHDHWHISDNDAGLTPVPGVELVLGFDWGLTPATLITQITPDGRWLWLRELQSLNIAADQHLEVLRTMMHEDYKGYSWRSWGDPAGIAKSQTDAKTCFQIAHSKGFPMSGGAIDWATRRESIKQRLNRVVMGQPALLVDRDRCPLATEGLLGAYRYNKSLDGTIHYKPMKNMHSHLQDAAQMIATREFRVLGFEEKERIRPQDAMIIIQPLDPFRPPVERRQLENDDSTWMSN